MTIEESISLLKQYIDYDNPDVPDFYTMAEAIEVVIKALEQEPCGDCISREAAKRAVRNIYPVDTEYDCTLYDKVDVLCVLSDLPPVTPQPKMGKWIKNAEEWQNIDPPYFCSECGNASLRKRPYCDSCGAKMAEIPTGAERSDKE